MKMYFSFIVFLLGVLVAGAQDSSYKELAGKYKFPTGSVIEEATITVENAVVTMTSSAGVSVLEKIKGDTFNVVNFKGVAIFKRNEAKKISGVHVDASGYVLDGVREDAGYTNAAGRKPEDLSSEKWVETQLDTMRENMSNRAANRPRILGCIIP